MKFSAHDDTGILLSEYSQPESVKLVTVNVYSKKYS